MDTLFEIEPICPECNGRERVWSEKLDAMVWCKCRKLPDPGRNEVQLPTVSTDTQQQAAELVWPKTGTIRLRVLQFIAGTLDSGATDEEIQSNLRLGPNTARPRRVELVKGGWITDSGKRRPTATGADSIVWVLTDRARRGHG